MRVLLARMATAPPAATAEMAAAYRERVCVRERERESERERVCVRERERESECEREATAEKTATYRERFRFRGLQ